MEEVDDRTLLDGDGGLVTTDNDLRRTVPPVASEPETEASSSEPVKPKLAAKDEEELLLVGRPEGGPMTDPLNLRELKDRDCESPVFPVREARVGVAFAVATRGMRLGACCGETALAGIAPSSGLSLISEAGVCKVTEGDAVMVGSVPFAFRVELELAAAACVLGVDEELRSWYELEMLRRYLLGDIAVAGGEGAGLADILGAAEIGKGATCIGGSITASTWGGSLDDGSVCFTESKNSHHQLPLSCTSAILYIDSPFPSCVQPS